MNKDQLDALADELLQDPEIEYLVTETVGSYIKRTFLSDWLRAMFSSGLLNTSLQPASIKLAVKQELFCIRLKNILTDAIDNIFQITAFDLHGKLVGVNIKNLKPIFSEGSSRISEVMMLNLVPVNENDTALASALNKITLELRLQLDNRFAASADYFLTSVSKTRNGLFEPELNFSLRRMLGNAYGKGYTDWYIPFNEISKARIIEDIRIALPLIILKDEVRGN